MPTTCAEGHEDTGTGVSGNVVLATVDAQRNLSHHALTDLLDIVDEWELHLLGGDQLRLALQIAQQALIITVQLP